MRGEYKTIFVLACFVFAFGYAAKQLEWENCDETAPVLVSDLTVLPYPISLAAGAKLRIKASINLKYTVSMKIEKKFLGWYPTIPCIKQAGSCDYNIGLQHIPTQMIDIPDISVPAFLTDGKYRVHADVREDGTKRRLFCVKASFEIDS